MNFKNPYKMQLNLFVTVYSKLHVLQRSSNDLVRIMAKIGRVVFNRFALAVISNNIKLLVNAEIEGMKFRARTTNSQFHSIYFDEFHDCYEPDVFGAITMFLPKNGAMIDIGSNWGHHTIDAAVRKKASVFAFEPNPDVMNDLTRIVSDLNLERVIPFNLGLGREEGSLLLTQTGFESGVGSVDKAFVSSRLKNSHRLSKLIAKLTFTKQISKTVQIRALDEFFVPNTKIDFIKIDCEGFELNALLGAKKLIGRDKPTIVFELHTDETSSNYHDFVSFFDTLDYEIYEIFTDVNRRIWEYRHVESLLPNTQYNLLAKHPKVVEVSQY